MPSRTAGRWRRWRSGRHDHPARTLLPAKIRWHYLVSVRFRCRFRACFWYHAEMTAIVLRGDAAHLPLPDASVDLICTSPPYFGLRAYSDGGEVYAGQIGAE